MKIRSIALTLIFSSALSSIAFGQEKRTLRLESVSYVCRDPFVKAQLEHVVPTVILQSFKIFEKANPDAADLFWKAFQERKAVVACTDPRTLFKRRGAIAISKKDLLGPYRIRIGADEYTQFDSVELKNSILHEFLHFAKFDNLSTRAHNHVLTNGLAQSDYVLSCAFAIYPSEDFQDLLDRSESIRVCQSLHTR